jgi:hypothetical protein
MDKSLKIVLIAFAIYTVLSLQVLIEKGFWLIPYNYNPITVFLVSFFVVLNGFKFPSFKINTIYLIGVSFYCFLSERILFLLKLYFNTDFLEQIVTNPFVRLFAVLGFSISLIYILILYLKQQPKNWFIFVLYFISMITGLLNYRLLTIILFTLFTIVFYILILFEKKMVIKSIFQPVTYQLLFFVLIEDVFFYYS